MLFTSGLTIELHYLLNEQSRAPPPPPPPLPFIHTAKTRCYTHELMQNCLYTNIYTLPPLGLDGYDQKYKLPAKYLLFTSGNGILWICKYIDFTLNSSTTRHNRRTYWIHEKRVMAKLKGV